MKKILYSCAIMALMASCSSDDEMTNVGDKFAGNVVLCAEGYEFDNGTRTSLTNTGSVISFGWNNGEAIGVFPIAPTTNSQAKQIVTTDADGLNAEFNGAGWALLKGNTYAAYSPCNESLPSDIPYSAVPVTMKGQKQTGNASLKHIGDAYDYMYAKADVPTNGGLVTFGFEHVSAIAMLQLTMPDNETWKSVKLASENDVFVSSCTMNVCNGELANKLTAKSQALDLANISGKNLTLYMALLPCTTGDITLTVRSNTGKVYESSLTGKTIKAGKAYVWTASPEYKFTVRGEAPTDAQAVDLGLPSGLKWANMNIGATLVTGYGTYFAWGEVTGCEYIGDKYDCTPAIMDDYPSTWTGDRNSYYVSGKEKSDYGKSELCLVNKYGKWENGEFTAYKYNTGSNSIHSIIGKVDGKVRLDPEDDAATVNWGGDWRMPTYEEQLELMKNCYFVWTDNYNGTGVAGRIAYKAKSESDKGEYKTTSANVYSLNDTHIFLPAAGSRWSNQFNYVGTACHYYPSTTVETASYNIRSMSLSKDVIGTNISERYYGFTVRAVCE